MEPSTTAPAPAPSVGRIVHYAYDDNLWAAAMIVHVSEFDDALDGVLDRGRVNLCVFSPWGGTYVAFNVAQAPPESESHARYNTWRWPPKV